MLVHQQPQPPHLLSPQSFSVLPIGNHNGMSAVPQSRGSRGFKGFFLRTKYFSSDLLHKGGTSSKLGRLAGPSASKASSPERLETRPNEQRRPSDQVIPHRRQLREGQPDDIQASPHHIRGHPHLDPSDLPAIQRGEDGRWKPPSLCRGSASTSALALYAQEEEVVSANIPSGEPQAVKRRKGHKHSFSVRFNPGRFGQKKPSASMKMDFTETAIQLGTFGAGDGEDNLPSEDPAASRPVMPQSPVFPSGRDPLGARLKVTEELQSPISPSQQLFDSHTGSPKRKSIASSFGRETEAADSCASASAHAAQPENLSAASLSPDHTLLLRLSTSYMIKMFGSVICDPGFPLNDRDGISRLADERLRALSRLEKEWGRDRVLASGQELDVSDRPISGSLEANLPSGMIDTVTKEKDREAWVNALKDGILLCS